MGNSGIGYIINDNGSNLQQFLPSNVNFTSPKFNGNGSEIFATGAAFNGVAGIMNPIYDLNANIVDSFICYFNGSIGIGSPSSFEGEIKDGLFSFADLTQSPADKGLGYIVSDTTFNPIISTNSPDGYAVTDIDKYHNLIYYVIYGLGFYQYNETTRVTTLLQEMCDSRKIIHINVSQISGNILIEEMKNGSISYFWFPFKDRANEKNQELMEICRNDGRVFLSSTKIDGKFVIRIAILSFRSHKKEMDKTLNMLKDCLEKMEE